MTQISRYVIDDKVTGSDKWIGSDAQTHYTTKNFTPTKLAVYFNENQVIDIGTPIRYRYDILELGDTRLPGTITFNPQVGTPYNLSNISSFILSKYTLKGNDVTKYLNFLIGSNVLIYKADDINIFGLYKVVSLVENIAEPDFFDVVVSYTTGNGSIVEDKDYLVSLIDIPGGDIPTKTSDLINDGEDGVHPFITTEDVTPQVNSDWNATSGVAEILNKPTKTSDFTNDGEDGVNPFITLNDIPVVDGFVPYTGATQDVNLGEFGVQLGNLEFDLTPTNIPTGVGSMAWNDAAGTLDLKLKGGAVTLQIGQETVARVVNKTATNITLLEANYQIVRVTGAQGQRPKVDLALANNDLNSTTTLGLVTETILNNQEGFITTSGQVQQINTTGSLQGETWADGDVLYLSGTVYGQATNIKPIAPIHTVIIGFVEYAHINQGKIFVKVDNGYELEELHNVSAIAPNNNEVLTYDSATLLWKPKTVFQLPSLTSGSVLFSNGTTIVQDNSNFFWDDTNNRLGIGTISPTAKLHVAAPGALSTDIALRVRNSANTADLFQVQGNGAIVLSSGASFYTLGNNLNFRSNLAGGSGFVLDAQSFNSLNSTSTEQGFGFFSGTFAPTSGTGTLNGLKITPTINQTGGASGITRGLFINPTLTSAPNFRAIETTVGNVILASTSGNVGIGTTAPTARLHIAAPGALSTDIALRVRNSADTGDLMSVSGNGTIAGTAITAVNAVMATRAGKADFYGFTGPTLSYYDGAAIAPALTVASNGSVLIGVSGPSASAKLDVNSTTQGFLPPRMTTTQKNAIATPASGLVVYDTTLGKLCVRGAAAWETITSI